MEQDRLSREEIVAMYKADVERLVPYINWLQQKNGQKVSESYQGQDIAKNSVTFPVYDSTLLQFVREVQRTRFINRNYVYVYSHYQIRSEKDELRAVSRATLQEMNMLGGILSRYIIKGTTKGTVWQEGVQNGVFLAVLKKMKELMDFWDKE
ncbi:MAG: hypothetical protein GX234_09065 [Clostridiales bacterium]|nr:hypothetical protein [Clostridiales bacterium]